MQIVTTESAAFKHHLAWTNQNTVMKSLLHCTFIQSIIVSNESTGSVKPISLIIPTDEDGDHVIVILINKVGNVRSNSMWINKYAKLK